MEHKDNNKVLTGKLKDIAKMLAKNYSVKIGLLADQGGSDSVSNNLDLAGLGAVMEYGAQIKVTDKMRNFLRYEFGVNLKKTTQYINIPARSWLYEPIKSPEFRKLILEYVGDKELFENYADKADMKKLANLIGEAGLMQIQKAFDNGGINGEWAANSPVTIKQKGSSKPLIDTGYLRHRITFEVEGA